MWVAGAHLTIPVVAETDFIHLLTVVVDVFLCGDSRMCSGLDSILLRWKSVGVVAHRVKHVKTFQTLVTSEDIRCDISERMAHVKTCSRRIRKHIQNIKFRFIVVYLNLINLVLTPVLLPFFLDFFKIIFHNISKIFALKKTCKITTFFATHLNLFKNFVFLCNEN